MITFMPVPEKYLTYKYIGFNYTSVLTIKPEIDEFVTSASRLGSTRLVMRPWPEAFAVRFEHEGDAALFRLSFPDV